MPYKDKAEEVRWRASYYSNNKESFRERASRSRKNFKSLINDLKSKGYCIKCGEKEVICLEFHHRNPEEKLFEIADGITRFSHAIVLEEINKCDLLCVNCHLKFHKKDDNYVNLNPRVNRNIAFVWDYKSMSSCAVCALKDTECLQFHHIKDKRDVIGNLCHKKCSIKVILEEIMKCILLCGNCHRKEHYGRVAETSF
jgi:hypothetical protein